MSEAIEEKSIEVGKKVESLSYRADFNKSLAKFRQQVKAPSKNGHVDFTSKKGRTKYDYTLLDDLIKSIDEGTKGTGLSWRQEAETIKGGVKVRTIISHENGYDYASPWITLGSGTAPQDVGSAITYAKRYSLGTTFGVSSESDDDGEAAQNSQQQSNQRQSNQGRQNGSHNQGSSNNNQRSNNQQPNSQNPTDTTSGKLNTIGLLLAQIADVKHSTVENLTKAFQSNMHLDLMHLDDKKADYVISVLTEQIGKAKAESPVDTAALNQQLDEMSLQNVQSGEGQATGAK